MIEAAFRTGVCGASDGDDAADAGVAAGDAGSGNHRGHVDRLAAAAGDSSDD